MLVLLHKVLCNVVTLGQQENRGDNQNSEDGDGLLFGWVD